MDRRTVIALAALAAAVCISPAAAMAQDADGDGVTDARDICPTTRTGRTVDSAGCDAFCEVVYDSANGSAFMRSRLLEVGTADWGSFGTVNAPPAGWHPRNPDNPSQFGFVANPADDDWVVYKGDFFVPGTPEEGFGMTVGGTDFFTSRLMGLRGVTGDFTGIRVECRPRICGLRGGGSVYWSGSRDGIDIDQVYSVFNEGVFILIQVTLTNTTATEQTVFYMRNVDPDNMVSVTGDYSTLNTIDSQGDGTATSLALVSATTGPAPNDSYIALGSSDPDARVTFGGFSNRDTDGVWSCSPSDFTASCTVGATEFNDIGISIAFRKVIPAGASRSFSYVYTLGAGAIAESISCTDPSTCGDGIVEGTESCDDGNTTAGDGCAMCDVEPGWECLGGPSVCNEICGDSLVVGAEVCDTGGASATCDADCTLAICGDGTLNAAAGETCDDGNTVAGDGCSPTCTMEDCGNGSIDDGEECDDAGVSATCDADCTNAACGDGTLNALAGEACDDGNTTSGDGCSATCEIEGCGNGVVDEGEECDDTGASATCDADCTLAICGDGTRNALAGEACDDGNTTSGDGCSATCEMEGCGNGVLDAGEECDDGGESATCDADCTSAACGDGVVNVTAGESCDDGNTDPGDACSPTCEPTPLPDAGRPDAGPRRYGVSGGGACSAQPGRGGSAAWLFAAALAALWISRRRRG